MFKTTNMRVPIEWKKDIMRIAKSRNMHFTKYLDGTRDLHKNADYLGKIMNRMIGRGRDR